jgi:arsenite/tail-anchored protein-transporting ATPase
MRIVLFTGKGGVGKTTIASATALRIAARGRKTLIMSTDPAHSLADAFDADLSDEPREIVRNLWAEQLDAQQRLEENWREIRDHAVRVLDWSWCRRGRRAVGHSGSRRALFAGRREATSR